MVVVVTVSVLYAHSDHSLLVMGRNPSLVQVAASEKGFKAMWLTKVERHRYHTQSCCFVPSAMLRLETDD